MPDIDEKSKETFKISYEDYFRTRFNGITEMIRALTPIMDEMNALEKIKELYKKKSRALILRLLKDKKPIDNFEEFKEIYKEQMSTDFMQHCLEFTIIEDSPKKLIIRFTKCLWAKTFLKINEPGLGYAMCCYPDYAMAKTFHPKLKLVRSKTLMQGNEYCESTYIWDD
ncbi:MAG: L-2-amino-thiazoline-4-carboxylic acid hydrolase [Candidatus Lokiarchaeota archaeon]|nr:L-2-amino-thiazoline-4-carboxylic acid hydrolase [Candidatus Lokiarchaeota archaeon]MCK4479305.1 L-2-amino-thiazoline-4-carboxylic acid hydrolase [Candidatus Lokiarchaeota archaeon]